MNSINTRAITMPDATELLEDLGIHEDWYQHSPVGDLSHSIYVHQVPEFVAYHATNPDLWDHTLCLLGPTAIGKTEGVRQGLEQAAAQMGRRLNLTELHVSQMGPVDALGVPREENRQTYWAPPKIWPLAETHEAATGHQHRVEAFVEHYRETGKIDYHKLPAEWYVHFHDEVTNPSSPQVPHQLFPAWCGDSKGRLIGGHRLVRDYFVVLAGNRVQDGTNSIALAASAVTRLGLVEVVPHFGGWLQNYAFQPRMVAGDEMAKIHPVVIAYLQKFSKEFAPQDMSERSPMDPFPTPRNWKFVSDLLYANDLNPVPGDLLKAAVAGRIGTSSAQQFFTFIEYYQELPNIDRLMAGAEIHNFPKKNRLDLLSILGTHMVMKLNASNARVFMSYMMNNALFPPEVVTMTMKQLRPAAKLLPLMNEWAHDDFVEWTKDFRQYVV